MQRSTVRYDGLIPPCQISCEAPWCFPSLENQRLAYRLARIQMNHTTSAAVAFKRGAYSKVGWKRAVVAFLLLLHPEAVFHLRVFQRCLLRGRQLCTACSHGNGSRGINELPSSCRCWSLGAVGPSRRSDYSGRGSSSRWPWNYGGMDLAWQQLAWQKGFLSAIRRGYCRVLVLLQTSEPP